MTAVGITERGTICRFPFKLGPRFVAGAGIAPTHGGFLMCGKDADPVSELHDRFSVSLNT